MACLDPETTDGAADMARTDNADFHFGTGRLTGCGHGLEHPLEDERSCNAQKRATTAINGDMLRHQHTNCGLQQIAALQLRVVHIIANSNAKSTINNRPESVVSHRVD